MSTYPGAIRAKSCTAFIVLLALIACDGPNEKAGREADQAAAAATGKNQSGEGPNERLGAARDRVEQADAAATDAAADALERQGDQMRTQADLAADRLDEQARAMRDAKKQQAAN